MRFKRPNWRIGENYVPRTFTSTMKDIIKKQMNMTKRIRKWKQRDTTEIRSIENNTKPINTRVRREVPFRSQRVKTEFFSVKDSRIVTLNLNVLYNSHYIPFSDLKTFVLNSGLLTAKKKKCLWYMLPCVYFCNNNSGNCSSILAKVTSNTINSLHLIFEILLIKLKKSEILLKLRYKC